MKIKEVFNKKNAVNIIIVAVLILLVIGIMIFVIAKVSGNKTNKGEITTTNVNNPYGIEPPTNIDGTPVEIQPYTKESGTPYVNEDGNPVYYVVGTENDKDGIVLVTRGGVDEDKLQTFVIQKVEEGENGEKIIKPAVDGDDDAAQAPTTKFIPTTSANGNNGGSNIITAATTNNGGSAVQNTTKKGDSPVQNTTKKGDSATQTTTKKVNNDPLPDTINLGGAWGTVTKDTARGDNVYKGRIVESGLETLKTPVTYSKVGATFTRGIYIPKTIGEYNVVQVAYTRFYEYKDIFDENYDWYTQLSIFTPGVDTDPLIYIEKNDTFNIDSKNAEPMKSFLIVLSR